MTSPINNPQQPGGRRYRLTAPLTVGPWHLPAVQIDHPPTGGWLACDLSWRGPTHNTWRIVITGYLPELREVVLFDVAEGINHPNRDYGLGRQAREVIAAVVSFLLAEADNYRQAMGAREPADGWIFNAAVAEWAYLNDDELADLAQQLDGAS